MIIKEACVENFTTVPTVIQNGARRIELCDNLAVGGTTPSKGVMAETHKYAAEFHIPVTAMIRPRGGNFVYTDTEVKIMEADIFEAQALGIDAVAFGALTPEKTLDIEVMDQLSAAAGGMQLVMHMAFDELDWAQQQQAIDYLVDRGVERILTHGGPASNPITANTDHLRQLIDYAAGRIAIMPGGGVTRDNYEELASTLKVNQVHGTKIV